MEIGIRASRWEELRGKKLEPNLTRSRADGVRPSRTLPVASGVGSSLVADCREAGKPKWAKSGAGGVASRRAEERTNEGRPKVAGSGTVATRPGHVGLCSGGDRPRCRESRTGREESREARLNASAETSQQESLRGSGDNPGVKQSGTENCRPIIVLLKASGASPVQLRVCIGVSKPR